MALQTIGKGWEFCYMPDHPWIGPGRRWNPVTGCIRLEKGHPCSAPGGEPYCYMVPTIRKLKAQGIEGYENFCFHMKRISEPTAKQHPSIVAVGTSGDMWSYEQSKTEQISYPIISAMEISSQHFYLFLTKDPQNLPYSWGSVTIGMGTTINTPADLWRVQALRGKRCSMRFVVMEPCFFSAKQIEELKPEDFDNIHWIIIGAMTGAGCAKYRPSLNVYLQIIRKAKEIGAALFMKSSMENSGFPLVQEFPPQILQWAEAKR